MAYIGRDTDKISNVEVLDNITFDGSSSYTLQKGGSNFTPSSANTLLVSIDGVVQAGNFTVSGSTIDFGTAVSGTSTCDFILHYGVGLITAPSDGTVTTAKLGDSAVTTAKIDDGAITSAKLASGVGGKILQVVSATDGAARSTTSTSFVTASNTLSVSITPSSASNKIFVLLTTNFLVSTSDSFITIFRDSTNLGTATHGMGLSNGGIWIPASLSILDSPATTSSVTYQVYLKAASGSTVYINDTGKGSITAFEVGA